MGKRKKQRQHPSIKAETSHEKPEKQSVRIATAMSISLIIIVGLLCYCRTFNFPFHFDSTFFIVGNPVIRDVSNLRAIWDYNPTRFFIFLSHALNYHFGGYEVFGYHLVNNTIHILNALLVFWFAGLLLRTPEVDNTPTLTLPRQGGGNKEGSVSVWFPLFAALLFVAHPIQTQAVTYIYQRSSSLCTLFYYFLLRCE